MPGMVQAVGAGPGTAVAGAAAVAAVRGAQAKGPRGGLYFAPNLACHLTEIRAWAVARPAHMLASNREDYLNLAEKRKRVTAKMSKPKAGVATSVGGATAGKTKMAAPSAPRKPASGGGRRRRKRRKG